MPKIGYNNNVNYEDLRRVGTNPTLNYQKKLQTKDLKKLIKRRDTLASIEERVEKLLSEKIESIGYELYDVEYSKEGKNYFLRIFIDKPDGIDLNDCEKVNNEINEILDKANYIKDQYFLEVSSPGIERIIRKEKHLKKYIGNEVNIKLFKKDEQGKKEYQGILKNFDQDSIELEQNIKIQRKNIAQIKTVYNW